MKVFVDFAGLFLITFDYSNLPNKRVGPFNHVGGTFSEINKRVGPNKAM